MESTPQPYSQLDTVGDIVEPITLDLSTDGGSTEEMDENLCNEVSSDSSDYDTSNALGTLNPTLSSSIHNKHCAIPLGTVTGPSVTDKTCDGKWTIVKVRVSFDITRKGERSLVVDGYKFTKSRDGMCNRVFWRCSRRECKATAVTVADHVEHIRAVHSHEPPVPAEFFADHSVQYEQEVKFNNIVNTQRPRARRRSQPGRLVSRVVFEGFGRTSEGDQPYDSYDPWLSVPNDSNKEDNSKVFELISPDNTSPARTTTNGLTADKLTAILSHLVERRSSEIVKSVYGETKMSEVSNSLAPRVDSSELPVPINVTSRISHSCTGQPSHPSVDCENYGRSFASYPTNGCRIAEDVNGRNPNGHSSLEQLAAVASSFAEGSGFMILSGSNSELDQVSSPVSNNLPVLVNPVLQFSQTPNDSDSGYRQANICVMRPIQNSHTANWNQSSTIFQPAKFEKNSHDFASEREPSVQQVSLFSTDSRDSHLPVTCPLSPSVGTMASSLELPFPMSNGVIVTCASNSTSYQSSTENHGGRVHIGLLEQAAAENLFVQRCSSSRLNSTSLIPNSGLSSQLTKQPCARHVLRDCDRPVCPTVSSTSLSYAVLPSYQPSMWESSTNPTRYLQYNERGVTPGKLPNTTNLLVHWKKEKIRESVEEDSEFDSRDGDHDIGFDNDLMARIGPGDNCYPCCACEQTDSPASLVQVKKRRLSNELSENGESFFMPISD
ncbi:hypothetical protein PHET_08761 [Paragonimus heterotremus]|uniref:C2H2-type domain-containing protein n=1 Tax=Paragonimus heterotremus TaxID=100268 RepID=A0A8J4T5L2_9TREM|nr:hypothetical protein PHET_08761 [Paragonimus heterotremus]